MLKPLSSRSWAFAALGGLLLAPAAARADTAPEPPVRYSMQAVEGGLMKLDTRTGKLTFCSTRAGAWACELVPEERTAYEDEISRLNDRIAALEKSAPGAPSAAPSPANPSPGGPGVPDIMAPPAARPDAGTPTSPGARSEAKPAPKPDAGDPTTNEDVESHVDRAMDMAERVFRRFFDMVNRLKGESEKL